MVIRLRSFADEQRLRGAIGRVDRGFTTVEVARIVGSVGRAAELDRRFRPIGSLRWLPRSDQRTERVRRLFAGGAVPPIEVYQIADAYFVLDGHHRVQVALERHQDFIDAQVVEYLPDRNNPANRVFYERRAFVQETGLDEVVASEPGRYRRLCKQVRAYAGERHVPAAARDWIDREYRPVVAVLTARRIVERFPGRGPGDVFSYVCDHRWYLSERRGFDVGIEEALNDFVERNAGRPGGWLGLALGAMAILRGPRQREGGLSAGTP